ncbi:hypothetical protein ACFTSF_11010 [Kribbella sp. NPDC056951]|uniref:hypothetical protein n=1 Tax=Kribbella sp. NPDC056951 TaxID=3345978 RepID=UPI003625C554
MDFGELAQTGATALVTAMATGAWEQLKDRVVRLFGRDDSDEEQAVALELEHALTTIRSAADPQAKLDVQAELRGQLRQRLRTDPAFAADFQVLVDEINRRLPQTDRPTVRQKGTADRGGTVIQAGRDVVQGPRPKR